MARSLKKGPYVYYKLRQKVDAMQESGGRKKVKPLDLAGWESPIMPPAKR